MALSGTLQLTSDYVPGYGVSDSRRSFLKSSVSRRTLAVLPCSSCLVHKLCVDNGHLKSAINKASFVCRASSSGHRRNNPDFSRNNKHGFRGRNRRNEDRDGLVDGGALEDSDMLSSKNGPMFSLSSSPKFQATSSSPGPREKEIVDLFRKVQAQLRARAAAKKEDKKTEEASKGQGGKESETVDSLLKLLRKHSGEQSKKKDSNFSSEKQQLQGDDDDDDDAERQDHSSNHFDSRNKDQNTVPFTRPASSFRRNSPVPRHKSQSSYSSEAEAVYDEASSYSVTWTQKKDQVESRDEPEYELEPEAEYEADPESEPTLTILESESEMKPESFNQEESEEDHEVALVELSDDDEPLIAEEETVKDEDLSALKLIELRSIAKSRGLKGISKMKKAELVDLLNKG
uniref:Rho-N domain-containing protein 1, chloroplastic n=1 Tax=Noccaea caerulescens TaxID=107243 RepID=A0A1J3IU81_NOCCA